MPIAQWSVEKSNPNSSDATMRSNIVRKIKFFSHCVQRYTLHFMSCKKKNNEFAVFKNRAAFIKQDPL